MRIPSLAIVLALAACVDNPDPRQPTLAQVQRGGLGGWIVINTTDGAQLAGELIAVDADAIAVLRGNQVVAVAPGKVVKADLYTYASEGGFGGWGALGGLSTISHGVFAVFSFPIWAITSGISAAAESRHVQLSYPADDWPKLAAWARFPQGLPAGIGDVAQFLGYRAGAALPAPGPAAPGEQGGSEASRREQAWQLTKRAADAARNGDCAQVRELEPVVAELDAELRTVVFGRDVAIARCLATP